MPQEILGTILLTDQLCFSTIKDSFYDFLPHFS